MLILHLAVFGPTFGHIAANKSTHEVILAPIWAQLANQGQLGAKLGPS